MTDCIYWSDITQAIKLLAPQNSLYSLKGETEISVEAQGKTHKRINKYFYILDTGTSQKY